jgi:inner membrane protease ATP23
VGKRATRLLYATMTSTPDPTPTSTPLPAPNAEDTRTFNRWRMSFGMLTGMGISEAERAREMERHHGQTCEAWKTHLMNSSQYVSPSRPTRRPLR